jgi:hypothetical protein
LQVHHRGGLTYIPVQVHIVGTSTGTGYYRTQDLYTAFCELNVHFAPIDFYFYIADDIHYINNTAYYEHDFAVGQDMMSSHNVDGMVNMYIVGDPAGNCGYFSPSGDAVAIAKGCAKPGGTTIAHELGHFFSLPHTFSGWEDGTPPVNQQERADGSNCATRGDDFCDTPADYLAFRWNCPWTGLLLDPVGDTVHPDGTLFMSYANDECTNRFSNEQRLAMRTSLILERNELIGNFPPPYQALGPLELLGPPNGAVNLPADYVELRWKAVPGATQYGLAVSRFAAFTLMAAELETTDTFAIVSGLESGVKYYWHVIPLTETNTCEGYTNAWQFTAGDPTGIAPLHADDIKLFPNPASTSTSLHVKLETTADVRVSSVDGALLWSATLPAGDHAVGLDGVTAGLYVVEATTAQTRFVQRLVLVD